MKQNTDSNGYDYVDFDAPPDAPDPLHLTFDSKSDQLYHRKSDNE